MGAGYHWVNLKYLLTSPSPNVLSEYHLIANTSCMDNRYFMCDGISKLQESKHRKGTCSRSIL